MILIDTDILLDVALDRLPYSDSASELLNLIEGGAEAACIAWHSVANIYYIMRPLRGSADARGFILDLTRFVNVATTDTQGIRYAAELPMPDLEDAMQVAAARSSGARLVVTRNLRDYEQSPIPAVDAQTALAGLGETS